MDIMICTDKDNFISIQCERALVEFTQDENSDCYPDSWMYYIWFDGVYIKGARDEMPYKDAVMEAENALVQISNEVNEIIFQIGANNIAKIR